VASEYVWGAFSLATEIVIRNASGRRDLELKTVWVGIDIGDVHRRLLGAAQQQLANCRP
jgi:hypothetical protein